MDKDKLMVGNLVSYKGQTVTVKSISVSMYSEKDYVLSLSELDELVGVEEVKPLPLSYELIVRAGFSMCDAWNGEIMYENKDVYENMLLVFQKNNTFTVRVRNKAIPVKYIHQLQNLSTALRL